MTVKRKRGPRSDRIKFSEEQTSVLIKRYLSGDLLKLIAADFGISQPVIYRIVKEAGYSVRRALNV